MLIAAASDVHLRNAGDRDGDPLTRVDIDRSHLQGHCVQGQPVSVCHTDALADFQDASAYDADACYASAYDDDDDADETDLCMYWIPGQTKAVPPGTSRGFRWQQPDTQMSQQLFI